MMVHNLERALASASNVHGWLTEREASTLFALAQQCSRGAYGVAVEIGSWKGKSSVMIASGLLSRGGGKLYCVDPFGKDEDEKYQRQYYDRYCREDSRPSLDQFLQNMAAANVSEIVVPVRGYSFTVADTWNIECDFLFIDANHEYEAVLRDCRKWVRFLRVGGILALHDVSPEWPGPVRVAAEYLIPPRFGSGGQSDTLRWVVKQ